MIRITFTSVLSRPNLIHFSFQVAKITYFHPRRFSARDENIIFAPLKLKWIRLFLKNTEVNVPFYPKNGSLCSSVPWAHVCIQKNLDKQDRHWTFLLRTCNSGRPNQTPTPDLKEMPHILVILQLNNMLLYFRPTLHQIHSVTRLKNYFNH